MPASCSFVLENSGVAEPQNIRDKFNEAYIVGHPVTERVVLDTMVTIVDAGELVCGGPSIPHRTIAMSGRVQTFC